jgi:hypothetical protein
MDRCSDERHPRDRLGFGFKVDGWQQVRLWEAPGEVEEDASYLG